MTQILDELQHRREEWVSRVRALADQITEWSEAQGWAVHRSTRTIDEKGLGAYDVPSLLIELPAGELALKPIGLQVIGGKGRVDLEAYPTLARVKLLPQGSGWQIMTDSNVPLRQPWESPTFVQLAKDLLS